MDTLLHDIEGFLLHIAGQQEDMGHRIAEALGDRDTVHPTVVTALQNFDRTRQDLEAVAGVLAALGAGRSPADAAAGVELEDLRRWLDGDRSKASAGAGDADLF